MTCTTRHILTALTLLAIAPTALAVKIGDISHLQGTRINRLVGMGLVVGLNGTGDGGRYEPAMRPLAQLYARFANPVNNLEELKNARNVAIVQIEVTLPRNGVREGDRVDVQVSSVGAAKSLAGGRLLLTPLVGPHPDDPRGVMALAGGPLQLEDPSSPATARIAQGATLEQDWIHSYIALGRDLPEPVRMRDWIQPGAAYITFVIHETHAEWAVAYTVSQSINDENSLTQLPAHKEAAQIAMAFDPRTVIVRLPDSERADPAQFIARLERLQLFLPFTEARVTINRKTSSVVITGDVEISPAVITYKGLTITTIRPQLPPGEEVPQLVEQDFIPIDPARKGGARLADLVDALNQLRVPAQDRITIIEQLHRIGKLHANLVVED
jgi:flagellar P-ring protein FlgI